MLCLIYHPFLFKQVLIRFVTSNHRQELLTVLMWQILREFEHSIESFNMYGSSNFKTVYHHLKIQIWLNILVLLYIWNYHSLTCLSSIHLSFRMKSVTRIHDIFYIKNLLVMWFLIYWQMTEHIRIFVTKNSN